MPLGHGEKIMSDLNMAAIVFFTIKNVCDRDHGVRLPDGQLVRIPHGAVGIGNASE